MDTTYLLNECYWYHSIDLPGYGLMKGPWELGNIRTKFLGNVDFVGKTVIEAGPASGRITLEMEHLGAAVTALEIGGDYLPDTL